MLPGIILASGCQETQGKKKTRGKTAKMGKKRHQRSNAHRKLLTSIFAFSHENTGELSGTGDSQRDSRESIRANRFAIQTPIFIARQADSPRSFKFPIRANHATNVGIVRIDSRESRH